MPLEDTQHVDQCHLGPHCTRRVTKTEHCIRWDHYAAVCQLPASNTFSHCSQRTNMQNCIHPAYMFRTAIVSSHGDRTSLLHCSEAASTMSLTYKNTIHSWLNICFTTTACISVKDVPVVSWQKFSPTPWSLCLVPHPKTWACKMDRRATWVAFVARSLLHTCPGKDKPFHPACNQYVYETAIIITKSSKT